MLSDLHEEFYFTVSALIPVFPLLGWLIFSTPVSKHVLLNSVMVLMVRTGKARGTFQIPCLKVPTVKKTEWEKTTGEEKVQAGEWEKGWRFHLLNLYLIGIFLVCLVTKSCYNDCVLAARVAWEGKVVEWEDLQGWSELAEGGERIEKREAVIENINLTWPIWGTSELAVVKEAAALWGSMNPPK